MSILFPMIFKCYMPIKRIILFFAFILSPVLYADLKFETSVIEDSLEIGAQTFSFTFKFKNDGNNPVKIISTETTCGCTVVKNYKETYDPNESGEIKGTFHVGDRRGLQETSIILKTDSSTQNRIDLLLKVKIENPIELTSKLLYWRENEELKSKSILITSKQGFPIKFESAESESKNLEITGTQTNPEKIEVKVKPKSFIKGEMKQIKIVITKKDGEKVHYIAYALLK